MKKRLLLSCFFSALLLSSAHAQTYNLQVGEASVLAEFPDNDQIRVRPFGTAAGNTGGIKLYELTANGGNYVGFRAPNSLGSDNLYTLPNGYGTSGYFLRTDGVGGLTWSNDVPSGDADYIHNQNSVNQTANWRITGSGQWGGATSKGFLSTDQGSSLELGGTGSPYIDLANATGDDFDARIQLTGDDLLSISGANVGIGTSSPSRILELSGTAPGIKITDPAATGNSFVELSTVDGGLSYFQNVSGRTRIFVGGAERMTFLNGGNVGIGTTAPAQVLHVVGNTRISGLASADRLVYANASGDLLVSTSVVNANSLVDGLGSTNYLARWTDANTLGTGVTYDNGVNVGVGTTTPLATTGLDVRAGSGRIVSNGLFFYGSGNAPDGLPWARLTENWGIRYTSPDNRWAFSSGPSVLIGYTPDGTDWGAGNLFVSGRVGIGTTGPAESVHTTGNIRADGIVYWGNSLTRTESRDNAGLRGDAGARSGFYETSAPSNYYSGASSWQHLLDVRHNNPANNYALQLAGSFFDQDMYMRKTNNNASQSWARVVTQRDMVYSQNRGTYSLNNSNSGYRTVGAATASMSVKTGDVIAISHTSKFRWTGGSGGDHPFYGIYISGCATTSVTDAERIGTADDLPRGQWQSISGNYVWVATCNGTVQFTLYVDNNSDADDNSEFRDIVIIANRY